MAQKKKARRKAARKTSKRTAASRRVAKKTAPIKDRRSQGVPESLRLRSASPSFTVNDIERSLAFYRDVLGFHVKDRWMHDGKLGGVELAAGAVTFFIGQDDWKKGRDRVKGEGFRVYCETAQSVDGLAERVRAKGGKLIEEPKDQPWGTRDFAVQDPDGFKITFSTEMK